MIAGSTVWMPARTVKDCLRHLDLSCDTEGEDSTQVNPVRANRCTYTMLGQIMNIALDTDRNAGIQFEGLHDLEQGHDCSSKILSVNRR